MRYRFLLNPNNHVYQCGYCKQRFPDVASLLFHEADCDVRRVGLEANKAQIQLARLKEARNGRATRTSNQSEREESHGEA